MKRAAILIGVNRTGGLPELNAAARSADAMYKWACSQHMDAKKITDARRHTVDVAQVQDAVEQFVEAGVYEQLLVYFAGHGVNLNYSEYWLLSDAPKNAQAAVNMRGSALQAAFCGIPYVVLISDACRTFAESRQMHGITGSIIFPNDPRPGKEKPVDLFYACTLGRPAYEVRRQDLSGELFSAVYTEVLLSALCGKIDEAIEWRHDTPSEGFVRPRKLRSVLDERVPHALRRAGVAPGTFQEPDAHIVSDGPVFLAQLRADELQQAKRTQDAQPPKGIPDDYDPLAEQFPPPRAATLPPKPAPASATLPPKPVPARRRATRGSPSPAPARAAEKEPDSMFESWTLPKPKLKLEPRLDDAAGSVHWPAPVPLRVPADAPMGGSASPLAALWHAAMARLRDAAPRESFVGAPRLNVFEAGTAAEAFVVLLRAVMEGEAAYKAAWQQAGARDLPRLAGMMAEAAQLLDGRAPVPAGCGFSVHGPRPARAIAGDIPAVAAAGHAPVLLEFADGRGTLLPALAQHHATLFLDDDGELVDLSYEGMGGSARWPDGAQGRVVRRRLRALAGAASHAGPLRFDADDAASFAAYAYDGEHIDPVLAVYGAYADVGSGHQEQVRSLNQALRSRFGAGFLDLDMLAYTPHAAAVAGDLLLPFPVRAAGWALMPALGITLPPALAGLERTLVDSPWTLFGPDGVAILRSYLGKESA